MGKKSHWLRYGSLVGTAVATAVALLIVAPTGVAEEGDPPPPSKITVANATGAEGGTAAFVVTLDPAAADDVTVDYATADGSAKAPADYESSSGTLTIPAGETTRRIVVPLADDAIDEDDETFELRLSNPSGGHTIEDAQAQGKITDGDEEPSISVSDKAVNEGNEGEAPLTFEVKLSRPSGKTITVSYFTEAGTAQPGEDFVRAEDTLTFAPGDEEKSVEVKIKGDKSVEGNETFRLNLRTPQNATIAAPGHAIGTIRNDDEHPRVSISIADADADEGDGGGVKLAFKLSLDRASTQAVSVTATTGDGTATAPEDYASKSQLFTFNPGQTEKSFVVDVAGDTRDEPDELMRVTLSDPTGRATIGDGEAVGRIYDHDSTSVLSVSDTSANEPSSGTVAMTFTVTLAPASARRVSVGWSTADGTASAPTDYAANVGIVDFNPGETTKTITVTVQGDTLSEPNETLFVNLGGTDGARVGDAQGLGTIVDKSAPPSLTISDTTGQEGEGATFVVTLTGTTTQTVTVRFATADGVATAPGDYLARSGTLTFAPGEKSKSIAVTVVDDSVSESDETFTVRIEDAVNATVVKSSGRALVLANDRPSTPNPPTTPVIDPPTTPQTDNRSLTPRMILSPKTVVVTRTGLVRLQLSCLRTSPVTCRGSLTLESAAAPKRKLGQALFTARPGKRVGVNVKLTKSARSLLKKRGSLRVRVRMAVRAGTKVMRVSPGVITLKVSKDDISIAVP